VAAVSLQHPAINRISVLRTKVVTMQLYVDKPLRMAANFSAKFGKFGVHQFVFKFCETKPATRFKPRETEAWPGICYYGADAARVIWSDETDIIYDGVDSGPFYSRSSLDADLAAADIVVRAIRCPQIIKSDTDADPTSELNVALQHVYAAVHARTEPQQDWLLWLIARLGEIPALPQLNRRGTPKQPHRGVGKEKSRKCACTRKQFVAKLHAGFSFQEVKLMWHDHIKNCH